MNAKSLGNYTTRKEIQKRCLKKLKKLALKNWDKGRNSVNIAKSIVMEAVELLENFQWANEAMDIENVKDERGNVLIYSLIFCYKNNFDAEKIILNKLKKTWTKNDNSKLG